MKTTEKTAKTGTKTTEKVGKTETCIKKDNVKN